jgi:uncharacterized membrane protein
MTTLIAQESWTRQWLSADTDRPGELRWQWMNLPESWGVFVWLLIFALVIGAAFWLYRRESQVCPLPIRMTLAGLRVAVLVFLLLLLFKPSVYFQEVTIIRPTFATLRDRSLSMDRADTYQDEGQLKRLAEVSGVNEEELRKRKINRADLVNRTLNRDQFAALNQLREKGSLQLIDFDDRLDPLELLADRQSISAETNDGSANESADPLDVTPLRAVGVGTDIWLALRQTLSEVKRLGAIILISDGQHKGSENPLEMAKRAAELNVPIYTIGVGDPTPERNVAVTEVNVPARAYLNEPFFIESVLQTSFSPDDPARQLPIEVQLYQQLIDPRTGRPGDAQLIDTQQTTLPDSGNRLRLQFSRVADQVAKYVYSIRVPEIEGETTTEDNRKTSAVTEVVDEKIRVLVISGLPNWDYQQLSRLLMRDGTILVSCWLQSLDETRLQEGDEIIVALPRTMEELGQYNAVIMIDPNPEEFDEAWMKLLQDFCRNKAGGLVYMAGPHFSGEFLSMNRLAGFRELLPVRFADANTIAASQVIAEATGESSGSMQIVGFNLEHDVMKLAKDPEDVQRIWNQMPGFLWNFPTLAAKPTARVLIERGDQPSSEGNQPMLVDGKFGAGTVLYFGFQGTWRWRSVGLQAQYFNSFWIQTVRYLVEHRSLQGNRRGFLDADQVEYELGSRITLLGDLVDEQFRPLQAESANVVIKDEEGRTQRLTLKQVPGNTGKFTGTLNAARIGNFEATFEVANAEPNQLEPATFRVTPPRAEVAATWLNERLLRDLAEQSGGAYFHLSEFDKLAAALPELETRAEFNSPPQPAWDLNRWLRGLAFLLPVLLLTIEWAIRKWYKLL